MKPRIKYMDIARGIGIICVLLGHTYSNYVWILVNTFHMPLFFIISGFFFRPEEKWGLKKNSRLLIPYCITIVAFVVFSLLQGNFKEAMIWLGGGVYGSGHDYESPFLIKGVGGIWFFLALFWVRIIANEIIKCDEKYQIWLSVLVTYAGVKTYSCFVFPGSIQNGMAATIFFVLGYYIKKEKLLDHIECIHGIICLIIWFYCYRYFGNLTMVNCNIPSIMTVIGALCGTMVILCISMLIDKKIKIVGNFLGHIGRLTMVILCVHIFELHTGILANIQNMLYERFQISINIFILRCLWGLGIAEFINKFITEIKSRKDYL